MNKTIVLIDDDEVHNFIAKTKLNAFYPGIEVLAFQSPITAIEYLKNNTPTLILLDVNMREYSGFQFIEKYDQSGYNERSTSIVLLSSSFFEKDMQRAATYDSVAEYKVKPCDFSVMAKYL